jgi:threonine/homoserine/homoserine lactone efflux protein
MTLSALGLFAGAIFFIAISPGPTVIALVARVITHGGLSVIPFTIALWIGEAAFFTVAVLGLAAFLHQFAWAFAIIKYISVIFLTYLACRMWFGECKEGEALPEAGSPWKLFLAGLAVTFTNAKVIAFYLALLPAVMDFAHISVGDWATLTMTLVAVLAMIDIFYIVLTEIARRRIRAVRHSRLVNKCSAVAMGSAAVVIAAR